MHASSCVCAQTCRFRRCRLPDDGGNILPETADARQSSKQRHERAHREPRENEHCSAADNLRTFAATTARNLGRDTGSRPKHLPRCKPGGSAERSGVLDFNPPRKKASSLGSDRPRRRVAAARVLSSTNCPNACLLTHGDWIAWLGSGSPHVRPSQRIRPNCCIERGTDGGRASRSAPRTLAKLAHERPEHACFVLSTSPTCVSTSTASDLIQFKNASTQKRRNTDVSSRRRETQRGYASVDLERTELLCFVLSFSQTCFDTSSMSL